MKQTYSRHGHHVRHSLCTALVARNIVQCGARYSAQHRMIQD